MYDRNVIICGVPECSRRAQNAAILGKQRFCMVPAMENIPDPLPLVRFNLCETHLSDVRRSFIEVVHDAQPTDFRDINVGHEDHPPTANYI